MRLRRGVKNRRWRGRLKEEAVRDGGTRDVVIIDCEGLQDPQASSKDDELLAKMFAFVCLVASIVVVNGECDKPDLNEVCSKSRC